MLNAVRRSVRSSAKPALFVLLLGLSALLIGAGQGWIETFRATFAGVKDGPGDGLSFPADWGKIATFTENGQSFPVISPGSGVFGERLLLTSDGGVPGVGFGTTCQMMGDSREGFRTIFDLRLEAEGSPFAMDVTDTTGTDIMAICLDEDGNVSVNGVATATSVSSQTDYRVDLQLMPAENGGNAEFRVILTNLDTGDIDGFWVGDVNGAYRPVRFVRFTKPGVAPGAVSLDNIHMKAWTSSN